MSGTLIYGLATLGAGLIGLAIRYAFRSKCSKASCCCKLVEIERDIAAEVEEEKQENQPNGSISRLQSSKNLQISNV